jgi:hypothetical protein
MDGMLSNRRERARRAPYLNAFNAVWLGLLAFSGAFWWGVYWMVA